MVKVWDAGTGQETLTLKGHTGAVISVAFSPDGRRILSGSDDETVKVWDASDVTPEAAERQRLAWHRQESDVCEKSDHWYAAAFHLGRLLLIEPDNEHLKERLRKAHEHLKAQNLPLPPEPVRAR